MAESASFRTRGAEISERSTELVLPGVGLPEPRPKPGDVVRERKIGVSNPETTTERGTDRATSSKRDGSPDRTPQTAAAHQTTRPPAQRGLALPGDRGRETQGLPNQRPSFWRRIALGRRNPESALGAQPTNSYAASAAPGAMNGELTSALANSAVRSRSESIEMRIMEPLLQALVSVESKLERSHIDLVGRSDQVEQRLTQLWDIEEQLGSLGEMQESLLQVSERQRRIESAIVSQNQTLRWLVGTVFFSLAVVVFIVAAMLR